MATRRHRAAAIGNEAGMNRRSPTALAGLAATGAYLVVAWMLRDVDPPIDAPAAQGPWMRPFRVIAMLGYALASPLHLPHLVGQLLAAIVLGGLLGAVFAGVRVSLR